MSADKQIYLRKGTDEDMDLLYTWANDPVTRANSFTTAAIPYEDHQRWFERMMANPDRIQYILMDCDVPAGQVRLDIAQGEAEISYSIDPQMRGKGYGSEIIRLIDLEVQESLPHVHRWIGQVKEDNLASQKCFKNNGFEGGPTTFYKNR